MEITELNPKIVWKYFHEITQVPRPSKKEEKIIAYLEKFAKDHGIEYKKDKVGNIVMCKPATPGYEDRVKLILQSHVDMVCEKNAGTEHDFDNDPIRTIIDGEWLHADGTTLGADNGIGCAAQLAVLASDDIEHGPIEALFTIDEETGMTGAFALQPGFLTGKILINLDSEDEGELFIGCAGGKGIVATFKPEYKAAPQDLVWLRASVSGLKGGHSGGEIHVGLGNANKLLTRYLYALEKNLDWCLAEIGGGNLHNAIPREAHALIGVKPADKAKAEELLRELDAAVRNELKAVDPKVLVESGIVGREVEVAVLQGRGDDAPRVAEPGEIAMDTSQGAGEFYDFETKYLAHDAVAMVCPARIRPEERALIMDTAARAFEAVGCEGLARVDFFLTETGEAVVNEINTMPGFTPFSMYPYMWQVSGLGYTDLVSELIELARVRSTDVNR